MYDDLWTAGKGMYKSEPVVADEGEVIIYAPHVTEVSRMHGRMIDEVGYHCRDYFLAQWDRFKKYPGGILAHSTHVKGQRHVRRGHERRGPARAGDARDRHLAKTIARWSISATEIRRPSIRATTKAMRRRSSSRARERCCIG